MNDLHHRHPMLHARARVVGVAALLIAAPALLLAACGGGTPGSGPEGRLKVVATVGMVGDIAASVCGDRATVRTIMGPGVDPHVYKPLRDDVAALMDADVVVSNGLLLEGKMGETLRSLGATTPHIALAERLDPVLVLHPDGVEGHPDPHVWMDAALWAQSAESFGEAMAGIDPAGAAVYRANAAAYADRCRELDEWGRTVVATIPPERRILVTSHDAFGYFGRAYGLRVEGVQGLSTESEAGLRRINELVDLVVQHRVPAVFVESSVPRKSIEALVEGAKSRGHDLAIGGELFSDAMGDAGTYEGTYLGMIDHNITLVVRALGGRAPERGWQGRLE